MIALDAISKGFGGRLLLREASWRIGRGERIGLVGPNGAGKTTLCRILAGEEPPDAGHVHRDTGVSVGYLPQDVGGHEAGTVLAEALSGFEEVWRLEAELERLAGLMADPTAGEAATERYGEIQHRFEALGGYRLEAQAKVILGGLGFAPDDVHRSLAEFSGGWRMRAALARLLLLAPDLLLLDEPTNHLDIESLQWLEGFLSSYEGSVVVVSHDRYFLNRMVTSIAEVADGAITLYVGDYDHFLVEREARQALLEARARNQAKRVAEIERFVERFRYQATKARQVQSRVKMLDKLERIEVGRGGRRIRFTFPQPPRTGRLVGRLVGIHKAYGPTVVYDGVDFEVERGQRVALVGINGAGKSTLLKILAGVLPIDAGERTLGTHVGVHYYAQHQLDALEPSRTVLEELEVADPASSIERLRTILGSFLFSGDDADKRVAVLSGGEKARVALAKMLVRPAALLCLDEPTNHLDLASKEVLEDALVSFSAPSCSSRTTGTSSTGSPATWSRSTTAACTFTSAATTTISSAKRPWRRRPRRRPSRPAPRPVGPRRMRPCRIQRAHPRRRPRRSPRCPKPSRRRSRPSRRGCPPWRPRSPSWSGVSRRSPSRWPIPISIAMASAPAPSRSSERTPSRRWPGS